ncbi:hypothetical protein AAVH_33312, partial [Aphelenchoides avenae]
DPKSADIIKLGLTGTEHRPTVFGQSVPLSAQLCCSCSVLYVLYDSTNSIANV